MCYHQPNWQYPHLSRLKIRLKILNTSAPNIEPWSAPSIKKQSLKEFLILVRCFLLDKESFLVRCLLFVVDKLPTTTYPLISFLFDENCISL